MILLAGFIATNIAAAVASQAMSSKTPEEVEKIMEQLKEIDLDITWKDKVALYAAITIELLVLLGGALAIVFGFLSVCLIISESMNPGNIKTFMTLFH